MAKREKVNKEIFIQGLLAGKSRTVAYIDAFPQARNNSPASIRARASKLAKDPAVVARMEAVQNAARQKTAGDFDRFLSGLWEIIDAPVDGAALKWGDKIRAMELLAKVLSFTNQKNAPDIEDLTPLADLLNADD